MAESSHVVLGVTGSIAAYKAAELVRLMKGRGWQVSVVMTHAATEFVGARTFVTLSRNPVGMEIFGDLDAWRPEHLAYAEQADVLVIAPCTANVIAKLAHGLTDDLLSSTALACSAPLVVAPAMNEKMWNHPATRENLATLRRRGALIVDVEEGELACGYQGKGRMAPLEKILAAIETALAGRTPRRTHRRARK